MGQIVPRTFTSKLSCHILHNWTSNAHTLKFSTPNNLFAFTHFYRYDLHVLHMKSCINCRDILVSEHHLELLASVEGSFPEINLENLQTHSNWLPHSSRTGTQSKNTLHSIGKSPVCEQWLPTLSMSSDISTVGKFYMTTLSHQQYKQVRQQISSEMLEWQKRLAISNQHLSWEWEGRTSATA
jgi:hypothetical protein